MTGLRMLVRLALRRDRVMIPAWVLGLGGAVLATSSSYAELYADEASRREVVATLGSTPATLALYGRIYADSVGGLVAWRLGGIALALAGLMSILIVVRHTRAEEETGRAELVGAGVVGRHAPLAAALLAATLASVALGSWSCSACVAAGLAFTGALALGAGFAAVGLVFGAVAAVTAQVVESARAASGLAIGVLGAAFALRAIGDAGPHALAWFSPLGWAQAMRAVRRRALVAARGAARPGRGRRGRAAAGCPRGATSARASSRRARAPRAGGSARRSRSPGGSSAVRWPAGPSASRCWARPSARSRRTSAT